MPECLADTVRAADSVQVCPHGPTCGGRLLSGLRRTVVSKERISRCFGRNTELSAAKVNRKVFSQRSGARGRHQKPVPTGISRRDSLPPLNAMPVVQAMQPVKRVLCKRAVAALGKRKMSPEPTTASSRNSLPALSAAAVVQVLCPYSVSCANGAWRTQTEGNLSRGGRRAPLTDGRKLARGEVVVDLRGSLEQKGGNLSRRSDECRQEDEGKTHPFPQKAAGRTRKGSSRKLWGFGGDYLPRCLSCLSCLSCLFCLFCLSSLTERCSGSRCRRRGFRR